MNSTIFINQTGVIGQIYQSATKNITGSEFLTLLGLVIVIIALFMMFGLPIEATAILILPMLIIFAAYSNELFSILGLMLLYIGILLAKNWLIS